MVSFSSAFNLNKMQAELDFVDIDLQKDRPLYLDPYALTTRGDDWSLECHDSIVNFFESVIQAIHSNDDTKGIRILSHLGEPEETHLGVAESGNKGRGIGPVQARELFRALKESRAARSGILSDISDFALFIPQVGRDKISDMTTNIIRKSLITYTQEQCRLYEIPMMRVSSGFFWDSSVSEWRQDFLDLPVFDNKKILLVPKFAVRYHVGVNHSEFRDKFVLEYLRAEHLRADDGLVTTLRNKKGVITKKIVYKKTVDENYPKTKDFLAEFSENNPEVINGYRDYLKDLSGNIPNINSSKFDEVDFSNYLINKLKNIKTGRDYATDYHRLMIGIISFIFFPNLIYPKKEMPINEGRKRIDIGYTNGKISGFFYRISFDQSVKANVIHVECKNYTNEIANAEFDQLLGRFDKNRGNLGILIFRDSDNKKLVLDRCRDAAKSSSRIVIPMDDNFIIECLELIGKLNRNSIDEKVDRLFTDIIS